MHGVNIQNKRAMENAVAIGSTLYRAHTAIYIYMCLKLSRTAKRIPLSSFLSFGTGSIMESMFSCEAHIASHQNRPQEDPEHEAIILKVDVIYDEKARMEKQRCRDDSLYPRVHASGDES